MLAPGHWARSRSLLLASCGTVRAHRQGCGACRRWGGADAFPLPPLGGWDSRQPPGIPLTLSSSVCETGVLERLNGAAQKALSGRQSACDYSELE